jgi:tetratricopeptide (TPR) repeat protein
MSKKYWETYFSAIKRQDWDQARISLENLASTDRDNPHVQLKLGDIYQRTGKTAPAIASYHKSAWILTKQGFAQKALALYKIILRLDSYNEEAMNRSNALMIDIESAKKQKQTTAPFVTKLEEAPAPPELPEKNDSGIQTQKELSETPQGEEEPRASIPSFFSSLSEDEIQYLIYKTEPHTFPPGKIILKEGDSGDSVFFIKSGRAKVIAHILGKEIELATLSPGDVFGEIAFLTGRPRTASVIALDELEVREFTKILLEEIFERYPSTLEKLQDFYHCRIEDTLRTVKNEIKKQDRE